MCNIETLEKLNSDPFNFSDIECHHKSYPYPVSIFENLKCRCLHRPHHDDEEYNHLRFFHHHQAVSKQERQITIIVEGYREGF